MRERLLSVIVPAAVISCAAPALAGDDFFGRTLGSFAFTDSDPPILAGTLDQFFFIFKGVYVFDGLAMTFEITRNDAGPDDMAGTFTFVGSSPADSLSGTYLGINFPNDDGIWTGGGTWVATTGTGLFEGLTGSGTYTTALFTADGSAATAFDGTLVPAPSGAAAVVGLVVFGRRRRR